MPDRRGGRWKTEFALFFGLFCMRNMVYQPGFVVFHAADGPRLSSQLDVIIHDALRNGPIVPLETCDVFPLEAVYGYVEVKATLKSSSDEAEKPAENSIEKCLMRNQELRNMRDRRYHLPIGTVDTILMPAEWASRIPSIRSYAFAFEASDAITKDLMRLVQRMADYSKKLGNPTQLHGLFIVGQGFLSMRPVDQARAIPDDYFHTGYTEDHPLLAFKTSLSHALARVPRPHLYWAPAIEQYFQHQPKWTFLKPQNSLFVETDDHHCTNRTGTSASPKAVRGSWGVVCEINQIQQILGDSRTDSDDHDHKGGPKAKHEYCHHATSSVCVFATKTKQRPNAVEHRAFDFVMVPRRSMSHVANAA